MIDENRSLRDPSTNGLNELHRNRSFKQAAQSVKSLSKVDQKIFNETFARTQSVRSSRSLPRTHSTKSQKSRASINEAEYKEKSKRAGKVAFSSLVLNIGTIIVAQLSIACKHYLLPEKCYEEDLEGHHNKLNALEEPNCSQIFEVDVDSLDHTFVSITIFSVMFDLPANLMLLAALKIEMAWLFLPWLVVTKIKIIGCIVVSCLLMHFTNDISSKKAIQQLSATNPQVPHGNEEMT